MQGYNGTNGLNGINGTSGVHLCLHLRSYCQSSCVPSVHVHDGFIERIMDRDVPPHPKTFLTLLSFAAGLTGATGFTGIASPPYRPYRQARQSYACGRPPAWCRIV